MARLAAWTEAWRILLASKLGSRKYDGLRDALGRPEWGED